MMILLSLFGTSYVLYRIYELYKKNENKKQHILKLLQQLKTTNEKGLLLPKLIESESKS